MSNVAEIKTAKPYSGADIPERSEFIDRHGANKNTMNNEVTRPEIDAKLEAIEARIDGKIGRIELVSQHIVESVQRIESNNEDLKNELRNSKWWAIGTAITGLGLIIAVIQLNVSWQQNYLTSLDNRIGYVNSKVDALMPAPAKPHK